MSARDLAELRERLQAAEQAHPGLLRPLRQARLAVEERLGLRETRRQDRQAAGHGRPRGDGDERGRGA